MSSRRTPSPVRPCEFRGLYRMSPYPLLSAPNASQPSVTTKVLGILGGETAWHLLDQTDRICTPAHSSITFAMQVKSDVAPNFAWVTASICRTADPTTIGTPIASASSTQRRTSL